MRGEVRIQGSKNAVLPMMAAAVLCEEITVIENCPDISDVHAMAEVIEDIGGCVTYENHCLTIDAAGIRSKSIEEKKVKEIRASVLLTGSMLARFGKVTIDYPGGCSIGSRPIDFHIKAFHKMGVVTTEDESCIRCETNSSLRGTAIELEFPSVGATENIILAAVLAKGVTWIQNAAREPEIVEFCHFLQTMGAKIKGEGTEHIIIQGVSKLHGIKWRLGADRIVFLTYAMMVAGCGGEAYLETDSDTPPKEITVLSRLGCQIRLESKGISIQQESRPNSISYICTRPYPGFPTDGQSLLMAVLSKSGGISTIEESIFENRFRMIRQLRKMGANIDYVSNRARITGVTKLHGAKVEADDLRSGAGLLIAAGMAEGITTVSREHFIHRGYEDVVTHMRKLGLTAKYRREE
ncbi:MAG: UDP-N-acetylglucosamine 1-carboxyvinyltransferase [Lachnospiraceae bacterium]|nr:UDP-N-acetylglucosamine 1-carboxyvinyltransferase [Lachnospiraceae bacterium]